MPEGFAGEGFAGAIAGGKPHVGISRSSLFSESLVAGILGLIDAVIVMSIGLGAFWAYLGIDSPNASSYLAALTLMAALTVLFFYFAGLYDFETVAAWPRRITRLLFILAAVLLVLAGLGFAFRISDLFSRAWVFTTFGVAAFGIVIGRAVFASWLGRAARTGRLQRRIAVVGMGEQARLFLSCLQEEHAPWRRVVGVFDDRAISRTGAEIDGYSVVGNLSDLVDWVRRGDIDDVVIAFPWNADHRLIAVIRKLRELPVHIYVGSDLIGYHFPTHHHRFLARAPVLEIEKAPFSGWSGVFKWVEDKALASILLVLLTPLLALVAMVIKFDSPGPVFFRQKRYGFNNQFIEVYKFRTMHHHMRDENAERLTSRDDSRVTRVGRFLRRSSIDELPQLINVLNGEMSLVGPRPHPTRAKAGNWLYQEVVADYAARHRVKPGITGWAQVRGWRGETDTEEKLRKRVEHDLYYIENWSVLLDIKILLLTAITGLVGKNAY